MGTSSSEGEGDYLMPWSRVLNWNRLPGELSSSLFLSLFLRPPSPLAGSPTSHLFPSSTSLRTASAFLVFSPPFFFLHLSIYYRPSSASPPRVLRTFLVPRRGREIVNSRWQNVASPRSYRKRRAKVRRSSAIYVDSVAEERERGEGKRQESEEWRGGRGGEGKREIRWPCNWM